MKLPQILPYAATLCLFSFYSAAKEPHVGIPFSDSMYSAGPQIIPGKVQCEYFDFGGEGVAFHESDSLNSGSGQLNPSDGSYLHEFRIQEAVDISYTKFVEEQIDNNPYNFVEPESEQLYVGWTEPGEWIKYTVQVEQSGVYQIGLMYTSHHGGKISVCVDDSEAKILDIPSTFVEQEPLGWRQWHHWNYIDHLGEIELEKGLHVLTLTTVAEGNMNYDYLNFTLMK